MKIQHGKYFVESDSTQFYIYEMSVFKTGKKIGEPRQIIHGYFSGLESTIIQLFILCIKDSDAKNIKELAKDIKKIKKEIVDVFKVGEWLKS